MTVLTYSLLAYDIACPKRWRRAYKIARRSGERIQYSVFLLQLSRSRLRELRKRLVAELDIEEGRFVILPLGRQLPDDLANLSVAFEPDEPLII